MFISVSFSSSLTIMIIIIAVPVVWKAHCVIGSVQDRTLFLQWFYKASIMICILHMSKLRLRQLKAVWSKIARPASGDTGIQQDLSATPVHSLRHCLIPRFRSSLKGRFRKLTFTEHKVSVALEPKLACVSSHLSVSYMV